MKKLYRYEIAYSDIDDSETRVRLNEYKVIKETEHSYFINLYQYSRFHTKLKRVPKFNQVRSYLPNRFAYINKKDAMTHFVRRTKTRIEWYKYWIKQCKNGLSFVKNNNLELLEAK